MTVHTTMFCIKYASPKNKEIIENRFSQLRMSLQMVDASEPQLAVAKPGTFEMDEGTKIWASNQFKTIEVALATFIDLAINPQPEPPYLYSRANFYVE